MKKLQVMVSLTDFDGTDGPLEAIAEALRVVGLKIKDGDFSGTVETLNTSAKYGFIEK